MTRLFILDEICTIDNSCNPLHFAGTFDIRFASYIFYRLYEDGHKKGSVIIQGLEEVQVRDKREVFKILEKGSIKRQTAETKMNANSSRSHTVFTVTVFVNQQSIDGQDMLKIGTGP